MNDIQLFNGDCLEVLPQLINDGVMVDMVLTDPPYGTTRNRWDSTIPLEPLWENLKRITYDTTPILLFSQIPFTITLAQSNIKDLRYEWIWEKEQGTGHLNSKRMPLKIHENILVFYRKLPLYNPQMRGDEKRMVRRNGETAKTTNYGQHIEIPLSEYTGRYPIDIIKFKKDKTKIHPTQKPVALLEYLIKTYTNKGDTVLDFTMGGGSTGVACCNTGRSFIGIELDEDYYRISEERINDNQKRLI